MKKAFYAVLAAFVLALAGVQAQAADGKLTAKFNQISGLVNQQINRWDMTEKLSKEEVLDPNTSSKRFKKVSIGYFWGGPRTIWLRAKYTVPEKILNIPVAGSKIGVVVFLEDWAEVYVNGKLEQNFRRSSNVITLTDNAKPGDVYYIAMQVSRKDNDTGLLRGVNLKYSILEDVTRRVSGIQESMGSLDLLLSLSGEDSSKWKDVLDKAADAIDVPALENGQTQKFYASLDKSREILKPVSSIVKKYDMYLIGYSHIDPAWLWDKAEGEHIVVKGTSEQILGLMKDFPYFLYAANQMHCYRWMERDYPEVFAKIKEKIKSGEWEPVGAEWVEPDGNLPSGEAYVRQFLYGRKYSKEKLGLVSTIGWTPDSFGYNWSMPQILAKSDMRGFVTQKISWNDTTRFPHNLFWWESPDGSKVLVYFPQGGYGESVHGSTMAQQLANMKAKHNVNSNLVIFGVGDHGGGIPIDYLERAMALKEDPLYPNIKFTSTEKVFDEMIKADKTSKFPTWDTELYLEYHRGTYTTQANTKNNNRRNEIRMMNSERFSTIASVIAGLKYPFDKIEEAWKIVLFNQFHDILPGSSITPVYKDADRDHAWVANEAKEVMADAQGAIAAKADTSGTGIPLVLFNGLSWNRDDVIETPIGEGISDITVTDAAGKEIPSQIITKGDGSKAALFVAKQVPAMGYAVYHLREAVKSKAAAPAISASGTGMENEFFKVTVDPKTGWVSGIFDKKNNKQVLESGKNAFELMAYKEREDSDAWDPRFVAGPDGIKPPASALMEMPAADKVEIVENGPVRVTIAATRKFGEKSSFVSYYSLVAGDPIVYGRLDADWHETNVFLKSAFFLGLDADYATFEIPYATIKRVTKPKTAADLAKWEMSGHRWVDYTDNSKAYGATLLSFSKYGYDVKNNMLRMTMLRCPTGPDPQADRGKHSIPLALYPHTGDWTAANSQLRGAEYNDPVFVYRELPHKGALGKSKSFFSAGPASSVALTTVKKAENGEGFVLRIVETAGKDGTATITLPAKPKKVVETNLVERELKKLALPKDNKLVVPLGHYEIKSIKVVF